MDIKDIEKLVKLIKNAKISELTLTLGTSTVRLKKSVTQVSHMQKPEMSAMPKPTTTEKAQKEVEPEAVEYLITAPMVGIFHSIESLSSPGASVKKGQTVGAIESMKLMNDVVADCDGIITEVLIEDGMPVEYGQVLFRLSTTQN
ncbi:MAG: acetyl-CoA carboxylase biotin carboxyl carrier protein subunit [Armatimonadota bacterium]|nr:acetyl-CoA carboxylase biotin carboxyl carrier protein subunit [Armatimonadota bacterium]